MLIITEVTQKILNKNITLAMPLKGSEQAA